MEAWERIFAAFFQPHQAQKIMKSFRIAPLLLTLLISVAGCDTVEPSLEGINGMYRGIIQNDATWEVDLFLHFDNGHAIGDVEYLYKPFDSRLVYPLEAWVTGANDAFTMHVQAGQDTANPRWTFSGVHYDKVKLNGDLLNNALILIMSRDETTKFAMKSVTTPPVREHSTVTDAIAAEAAQLFN